MSLWQDVRFGARMLFKDRWFTLAAALALALGIGVNNTVFTFVNAVLLRPLPFKNSDRVIWFGTRDDRNRDLGVSIKDLDDWRAGSQSFTEMAISNVSSVNLSDDRGAPEQFVGSYASANLFRLLGQQPVLGRDFLPEDDQPSSPPTMIITGGLWKSRYGGDPAIIGKTVSANSLMVTIIGVMPDGMKFPFNDDMWIPFAHLAPGYRIDKRDARNYMGFGRLKDGVPMSRGTAELVTIGTGLSRQYPDTNKGMVPTAMTFGDRAVGGPIRTIFLMLMGAVAFVLLIACANVANLLLARSAHRVKEISIRVSLGASRWQIVRQLLVESVLLSAISGIGGFALSILGIRWFDSVTQDIGKPYWIQFTMDARVFFFFVAVCLATGILFGLAPALHVSKTDINEALKEGGGRSAAGGIRARRWTAALVTIELALTVVLLAGAGFMMRSFLALYSEDLGFNTSTLTTARLVLVDRKYPTVEVRRNFFRQLDERLAGIPGLNAGAVASTFPMGGGGIRDLQLEGQQPPPNGQWPTVTALVIGARYFETLGVRLPRGRPFNDLDGTSGHESVIVNQRFVAMHFGAEDPVGRRIRLTAPQAGTQPSGTQADAWVTVVGVAPTIRQRNFQDPLPDPVVYLPLQAEPPRTPVLIVRASGNPAALTSVLREQLRTIDPDMPLFGIMTMDQALAQMRWTSRVFGTMFAIFAFIALVLAAVGLYAVTAYSVTQRTPEIGIRLALGAQPWQIRWLILRRVIVQVTVGLAVGLGGALGVGKLLTSVLVQTSPNDPATLISIAAILVAVSVAASVWPARRATRLDPAMALRYE